MKQQNNFVWINKGTEYTKTEAGTKILDSDLPVGLYKPVCQPMRGWFLQRIGDKFSFPFKVYNLENEFIEHVLKTWNYDDRNLGILLNGTKGTGKTVSGKWIANSVDLPIILVEDKDCMDYLKEIDFDCVMFFDEYEKNFGDSSNILTLMDGMYSDSCRKLFILTTNVSRVNENLKCRPSRIRYFKEFGNIKPEIVKEYLNDNLTRPERAKDILEFIDTLTISTIDIIKAIVDEINLHNCSIKKLQEFMNLEKEVFDYRTNYYDFNHNYNSDSDSITSFVKFIETCGKLEGPGENRYGVKVPYLTAHDLDLNWATFYFSKPLSELKIGDLVFDDDEDWTVKDIQDCYIHAWSEKQCQDKFIKVLNPEKQVSLYKGHLW